jgi:hypothetical protein
MSHEISFEDFKYTEKDYYRQIRKGNNDVSFSYLINYVIADMDKHVLVIEVDDLFKKICEEHENVIKPDNWKHPYLWHIGEIITNPIGEQLIAFCETDFIPMMKLNLKMFMLHETLRNDEELRKKYGIKNSPVVKKPTTDEELDILYYENYEYLASTAEEVISSNLYVNLFPPLVRNRSYNMCKAYFNYILALQQEYQKLLDFCFNVDFYAEELEGITAASRFHLYCGTTDTIPNRTLSISFRLSRHGFGNISATGKRGIEAHEKFMKNPAKALGGIELKEPNAFEREYNINPRATHLARIMPVPIVSSYRCDSLEEILFLEFEKMLELDLRIKKCKNCEKYFIFKGNYQTEYCDRVPNGETQNCQNIGATNKYAQKVKDNPALVIFNRAYKRYHARAKVGSMKPDAFKKWKYEAVVMRDRCLDGEITVEDFTKWIDEDKKK